METLSAFNAKTHFGTLLDRVESGEEIVITRRGQAIARVIPEGKDRVEDRHHLMRSILASRATLPSDDEPVRHLIDDGRHY